MTTTSPDSAERDQLALVDPAADHAPSSPDASDGTRAEQDSREAPVRGRDRGKWWKIRQAKPGPPPPHPEPLQRAVPGSWLADTGARGWSTLHTRLGAGWEIRSGRAIGTRLVRGKPGDVVETISVCAWHRPTGARAVAVIARPYVPDAPPTGGWAFHSPALVWVDGHSVPVQVGSRVVTNALKGAPPLTEDGSRWDVTPEVPTEEKE